MSYILDALRKSDQQRQRGAAPTLLAVQTTAAAPKQPALLAYGLLAVGLVGAGVVIGWLRPWQSEQATPVPEPMAAKPLESTPLQSTLPQPAPEPSESAALPKPESKLQNAAQPGQAAPTPSETAPQQKPKRKPKPELSARAKPETDGAPRNAAAAAPKTTAEPALERPVDTVVADAAGEQTVISMAELPSSIREELPAMTISVHAYSSNPGARLLGMGNRILREGDFVAPGLQLEEITPEGMILRYKGYRFRRGVK
jgi:general secretion pathway protein B